MVKLELEFPVKSSVKVLFNALSSPSGLSDWFCDNVNLDQKPNRFNFIWDDAEQKAEIIDMVEDEFIKFKWVEEEEEEEEVFFEFRIIIDELTGDMELKITDFAEEDDVDTTKALWESQVRDLFKSLGV